MPAKKKKKKKKQTPRYITKAEHMLVSDVSNLDQILASVVDSPELQEIEAEFSKQVEEMESKLSSKSILQKEQEKAHPNASEESIPDDSDDTITSMEPSSRSGIDSRYIGKGSKPLFFLTPHIYSEVLNRYPELQPNPNLKCMRLNCNKLAIQGDKFCLSHTMLDLTDYDIPWMCKARNQRAGIRCTRRRLRDYDYCPIHDPERIEEHKIRMKELTQNNCLKTSKHVKAKEALRSKDVSKWVDLPEWNCLCPRDLLQVMVETTNRLRMGTIPISLAEAISNMVKRILEILITEREMGWVPAQSLKEEMNFKKETRAIYENVVSFSSKLEAHIKDRELRLNAAGSDTKQLLPPKAIDAELVESDTES